MISYDESVSQIIKTLCRNEDTEEEKVRANEACNWLVNNWHNLKDRIAMRDETIIGIIYRVYWDSRSEIGWEDHWVGATIGKEGLLDEVMNLPKSSDLSLRIEEIFEDALVGAGSARDLSRYLVNLAEYGEEISLLKFSRTIAAILEDGWEDKKAKDKPLLHGSKDAKSYIYSQLEKGLTFKDASKDVSKIINKDNHSLINIYDDREGEQHTIPTGIAEIDEVLQIQRGHLVGILGYNKHRKTTLGRSFVYNAINAGLNVLHLTWEQTYEEELTAYQIMHTVLGGYCKTVNVNKVNRHKLTEFEKEAIRQAGLDLDKLPGILKVIEPGSRSWDFLKTRIELEFITTNYDLVFIDYLGLASAGNSKDKRESMDEIIRDAKQLAKSLKVCIMTPIQGNREGAKRASENEGSWDKEGVESFSEFNKSCNSILSVFYDDDLKADNEIIIDLLLSRSSGDMKKFMAKVDNNAGYIFTPSRVISEKVDDDVIEKWE